MIQITNVEVVGWESAIRGMRNPLNSWDKSDSSWCFKNDHTCRQCQYYDGFNCYRDNTAEDTFIIGFKDLDLMRRLTSAGSDHAKYRRMITVYADINAPLYWWKEYDTYKVGTVANSCSTMHKIHAKEFTLDDFSCEHLTDLAYKCMELVIDDLNIYRLKFLETKDKAYWWNMIQLLPSSYNQRRTVQLNYEVLANIYHSRKNHKLDEWRNFCTFIEQLPYSELITGQE